MRKYKVYDSKGKTDEVARVDSLAAVPKEFLYEPTFKKLYDDDSYKIIVTHGKFIHFYETSIPLTELFVDYFTGDATCLAEWMVDDDRKLKPKNLPKRPTKEKYLASLPH